MIAKVTSKGQITIPKAVRTALNLRAGDKVEFIVSGDHSASVRPVTKSIDEVYGKLNRYVSRSVSVDEINEAIKNRFRSEK